MVILTCMIFLALVWSTSSLAAQLNVVVSGVRNDAGNVRVALYLSAAMFATKEGRLVEVVAPARMGAVTVAFRDVPPGTYGLAAFHDENNNVEFDTNFLGVPEEGFGFGNDAYVALGPPEFSEAAVSVGEEGTNVRMTLRYW